MNVKLIGTHVQYIEVELMPGEEFYGEKGALIYMENGVEKEVVSNGRGLGRLLGAKLSGESFFTVHYVNRSGSMRKLVIGSRNGLVPVKIGGDTLICRSGAYVASSSRVDITTKVSISGFTGGMGFFMQKITGTATVFLDTNGQVITKELGYGETIEVDEDHIVGLLNISESQMSSAWSLKNIFGGEGLSMLRITGPGRVYLSPGTMFEPPK